MRVPVSIDPLKRSAVPAAQYSFEQFNIRHDLCHSTIDLVAFRVYAFNVYKWRMPMPRAAVDDNNRVALRVRPADKAVIMRAVALAQTDMTTFILQTALREAQSVIEEHERVKLTQRDSRLVMELLENPPAPNSKLRKAARAIPERR
jgi:uncharacterized protein (DUF1778 family)